MKTLDIVIAMVPSNASDMEAIISLSTKEEDIPYLNRLDRIPHLTLSMLSVKEDGLSMVRTYVSDRMSPMVIQLNDSITVIGESGGSVLYWLECERSDELLYAHALAMELRKTLHIEQPSSDSLSPGCAKWMQAFEDHSGEYYKPHFTLGKGGEASKEKPPKQMVLVPEVLLLYDNCLCRRISDS